MVRATATSPDDMMSLTRRQLLSAAFATATLQGAAAFAGSEPFPVFESDAKRIPYKYRRREANYQTGEPAGTIIVDPKDRFLYLILGNGKAMRYGASVGKAGRTWSGDAVIKKMAKWPTWTPTPEHIAEFPKMVKWKDGMPGGLGNPMGARALYLYQGDVDTIYRIHGTHDPKLVGKEATAGCFGLLNSDIIDLFNRVKLGARVVVLPY